MRISTYNKGILAGVLLLSLHMGMVAHGDPNAPSAEPGSSNGRASIETTFNGRPALAGGALCGPSCVFLLLRMRGEPADLSKIVAATPNLSAKDGCSLQDLQTCARRMGLDMRASRINLSSLESYTCPFVLHTNYAHFFVINKVYDDRVVISNPTKKQPAVVSREEFCQFVTPEGLIWQADVATTWGAITVVLKECALCIVLGAAAAVVLARCCGALRRTITSDAVPSASL
jgi:hypothetical protein